MAKLTIGGKAHRVLRFLLGVRNRRVSRVLQRHGFDQEELERGWTLLRNLSAGRLNSQPSALDPALMGALDVWENRWFPIAEATLTARAPAARDLVFRNLSRTEGPAVVISVGTFLERLEALPRAAAADGGLGEDGESARELLARRGLTEEVVAEARSLLERVGSIEPPEEPEPEDHAADEAAEQELWTWYLEWSAIARVAISDRRLLRSLGFLRYKSQASGAEDEDESDDPEDPEDVVEPAPTDEPAPMPN
ncbi:MAG: hypothetical protein SangKO_030550 [Sandaracinaceae bacterium]